MRGANTSEPNAGAAQALRETGNGTCEMSGSYTSVPPTQRDNPLASIGTFACSIRPIFSA